MIGEAAYTDTLGQSSMEMQTMGHTPSVKSLRGEGGKIAKSDTGFKACDTVFSHLHAITASRLE